MDIAKLIEGEADRSLRIRIRPVLDARGGRVTIPFADVDTLRHTARRGVSTVESSRIVARFATARGEVTLTVPEAEQLYRDIRGLGLAVTRAERIRRGQYVGPMSPREAAQFQRARLGI